MFLVKLNLIMNGESLTITQDRYVQLTADKFA